VVLGLWVGKQISTKHEEIGMRGANLEEGAKELIEQLYGEYHLVILN
jgi:hypothetical protein